MLSRTIKEEIIFLTTDGDGLMPLFLSRVARRGAIILVSLFSPVYIFQTFTSSGLSVKWAILVVILFFIVEQVSKLITLILAENASQKFGFKGIVKASTTPFFFFVLLMFIAPLFSPLFFLAAVVLGIHNGLFWWGYQGYFTKIADKKHFGLNTSKAELLETSTSIFVPLIGGVIANYLGFFSLYVLSFFFMGYSHVVLGKDHDKKQRHNVAFSDIVATIKTHKPISLAYFGAGAEAITYVVFWPLFLFLIFGQVVSLGVIVSTSSLIAAVFALSIGEWVDKQGERRIVRVGSPLIFLSWVVKVIERSFGSFVLADSLWNFGQRMVALPLAALTYKKAIEGESVARAVLFRETTQIAGTLAALFLAFIITLFLVDLRVMFALAAIFSLLPLIAVFMKKLSDTTDKIETVE